MNTGEILSEKQARAILGLAADAAPSMWRAAFQREVKAAHPDRGGDPEHVRLVIEAYRFLKLEEAAPRVRLNPGPAAHRTTRPRPAPRPAPRAPAAPKPEAPKPEAKAQTPPEPAAEPETQVDPPWKGRQPGFRITIVEAFKGCEKMVRIKAGRKFRVRLPGGLQSGDVVRFGKDGEHHLVIEVAPHPGAELRGADLWLRVSVSAEFLQEGGRMEVETPFGPRQFWVSRTSAARGVFRSPGDGLPAQGSRARGNLYLKFEPDSALDQKPSSSLLRRFAAAWASA
jgi:curved DNA-binding protein